MEPMEARERFEERLLRWEQDRSGGYAAIWAGFAVQAYGLTLKPRDRQLLEALSYFDVWPNRRWWADTLDGIAGFCCERLLKLELETEVAVLIDARRVLYPDDLQDWMTEAKESVEDLVDTNTETYALRCLYLLSALRYGYMQGVNTALVDACHTYAEAQVSGILPSRRADGCYDRQRLIFTSRVLRFAHKHLLD